MVQQVDRTQIANRGFVGGRVQQDLGAQIAAVDDTGMILGRADVGGILEGDPGMTGFKQPGQHLSPQIAGLHHLVQPHLALAGQLFVLLIAFLERLTHQIMQIGRFIRAEQRPAIRWPSPVS